MTDLNPTIDVRPGERLDPARLHEVLRRHIDGLHGQPEIRQYPSGNSNLTYAVSYPDRDLVLRRPPFGTKARSAHDMHREYRVMNALRPVFPWVPETLLYSSDEALLGSEFYVMTKVPGHVLHTEIPAELGLTPDRCGRLCTAFWDTLVQLHSVDFQAIGLADFGRPDGYVARQIHGWNKRYVSALTPDVDDFAAVRDWLVDKMPAAESGGSILHGDYRIDNAILDRDDPTRIVAILDWEISALGDPLMDLGNSLAYWIQADDPPALRRLSRQPSHVEGMLTRDQILQRYADATGASLDGFDFYLIYGHFRLAVILQQIYYRYFHRQTRNKDFAGFGQAVEVLGNHCLHLMQRSSL